MRKSIFKWPAVLLGLILVSGCGLLEGPEEETPETLELPSYSSQIGYTVKVEYESARAVDLVRKALFWRGRAEPTYRIDHITPDKKIDYLIGINAQVDVERDVDVWISEAEALQAFKVEMERARQKNRPGYMPTGTGKDTRVTQVLD